MKHLHPSNTPLSEWPDGWLKMQCASLLKDSTYIALYDHEKQQKNYPVTRIEMIDFIKSRS